MANETLEEALAEMGLRLGQQRITSLARKAYEDGRAYRITIDITPEKSGPAVTAQGRELIKPERLGRLTRLR